MSEVRHPRSHVDDLVSAELLGGISLLLPADTDLQTPLEGELGLDLLLLAQGKTLLHQLDHLGGPPVLGVVPQHELHQVPGLGPALHLQ